MMVDTNKSQHLLHCIMVDTHADAVFVPDSGQLEGAGSTRKLTKQDNRIRKRLQFHELSPVIREYYLHATNIASSSQEFPLDMPYMYTAAWRLDSCCS